MRATAKLVNAINNGSIAAFVATDTTRAISNCTQCRQINPMGGLDSDFTLDPTALKLSCTPTALAQGGPNGVVGITVMLPAWAGAKDSSVRLDFNLNVVDAYLNPVPPPYSAALTTMANAGYFA